LVTYSSEWPRSFEAERVRIVSALGDLALEVHHAGSTSVPGLRAKPIIDVVLVVPDTTDEGAYVPPLEAIGYTFRRREPEWFEHRLLRHDAPAVNLHVFPPRCIEVTRMLRSRPPSRARRGSRLYESAKAALRNVVLVQDYASAKDDVVAVSCPASTSDAGGRVPRPAALLASAGLEPGAEQAERLELLATGREGVLLDDASLALRRVERRHADAPPQVEPGADLPDRGVEDLERLGLAREPQPEFRHRRVPADDVDVKVGASRKCRSAGRKPSP
jgi:GrpB-like predicted nucleotidyltransferase (UPF0157 family)